ncbi:MAG: hypothetical protein QF614_00455 [SAR324 cluster bacterium]|nr:hypothetical protein [SAR324 cluster bacterium]MDP7317118.1 hypothetical protein [SAR324 cluster bacterium]MDP7462944.1 hypothetical protein [SAR324 cluster bacterium]
MTGNIPRSHEPASATRVDAEVPSRRDAPRQESGDPALLCSTDDML